MVCFVISTHGSWTRSGLPLNLEGIEKQRLGKKEHGGRTISRLGRRWTAGQCRIVWAANMTGRCTRSPPAARMLVVCPFLPSSVKCVGELCFISAFTYVQREMYNGATCLKSARSYSTHGVLDIPVTCCSLQETLALPQEQRALQLMVHLMYMTHSVHAG